jgi:hypothetical protein
MLTTSIDAYRNLADQEIPSAGPLHPPFTDPRAKQLMSDLHETFHDVFAEEEIKSSPDAWEEAFRCDYTISQQIALWLKTREVYIKTIRGHWNNVRYRRFLFTVSYLVCIGEPEFLDSMVPQHLPLLERVVNIFKKGETLEQLIERIKSFLPPDKPFTKRFPVLPNNPEIEAFLQSVAANLVIPEMPKAEVRRQALATFTKYNPGKSIPSLDSLCVHWLRHAKANYDAELHRCLGKLDVRAQDRCHAALNGFILDKIAEKHPWLEKECMRQRTELGGAALS